MALLPQKQNTTAVAISDYYESGQKMFKPRPHLGASIIGNECERALWYSFRWATRTQFSGRMLRLFDTGNRQETRMVCDLRNAGVQVHEVDPATGKQFQFRDHGNHFSGSMDGCVLGLVEAPKTWHCAEFKTHNQKWFDIIVKEGVQKAQPKHYAQMQTYMGWSGMKRAFYLAVNKNTDELYCERIEFDAAFFERVREKAKRVIDAVRPPPRISDDPEWFECRFCDHHPICHVGNAPAVSCRTCLHSTPVIEERTPEQAATWRCERYNVEPTPDEQLAGCASHLFIPELLPFADVLDASEEWVSYLNNVNGKRFVNCTPEGRDAVTLSRELDGFAVLMSGELAALHPNLVGDPKIEELRLESGTITAPEAPKKDVDL